MSMYDLIPVVCILHVMPVLRRTAPCEKMKTQLGIKNTQPPKKIKIRSK